VVVGAKAKSFRLPSAHESLSLCVAKEKVTQEKGHPAWRFPGILPGKCVRAGRVFRPDSCPVEKGSTSLSSPLRALSSVPHRRTGGPEERARILRALLEKLASLRLFCSSCSSAYFAFLALATAEPVRTECGSGMARPLFGPPVRR